MRNWRSLILHEKNEKFHHVLFRVFRVELNNKTEQNVTKPTKLNKTAKFLLLQNKTTKNFVPAQQKNKTAKKQNNKTTKYFVPTQQNNKIFCFCTTKQQNILLVQNKTTKFFDSNSTKQQNILLFANIIFCWFIDYPYRHRAKIHFAQIDILYIVFINILLSLVFNTPI